MYVESCLRDIGEFVSQKAQISTEENYEIPKKNISEGLRKLLRNFTLNFYKVCRKSAKFQNKFRER